MANWRAITRADVTASLTLKEAESYQRSADFGEDPLPILIERTTAYARLAIRSNGRVRMSPDATTLPASVISPACDYMIFDILKRIDVEVGEDRRRARQQAIDFFDRITKGEVTPEGWDEPENEDTGHSAAQLISSSPQRVTPMGLEGF
jgi:hypothetical protein